MISLDESGLIVDVNTAMLQMTASESGAVVDVSAPVAVISPLAPSPEVVADAAEVLVLLGTESVSLDELQIDATELSPTGAIA